MALVVTNNNGKISLLKAGDEIPTETSPVYIIQAWCEELELLQKWCPHIKQGAAYSTGTVMKAMAQFAAIFWNHNTKKANAVKLLEEALDKEEKEEDDG